VKLDGRKLVYYVLRKETPMYDHEDNDDLPVGRILSRREVLKVFAGAGAAMFVGYGVNQAGAQGAGAGISPLRSSGPLAQALDRIAQPRTACVVRPAAVEGPFFIDGQLNRSDIRVDSATGEPVPGVELNVTFNVSVINGGCAPLEGAVVDLWQCDAVGHYSGVSPFVGHDFLRGYQTTDANGNTSFTMIYPGWYPGRTTHTHFKIRTNPSSFDGGYVFTTQLFYDDTLTDQIYLQSPYNKHMPRDTTNATDGIYQQVGGAQLQLVCVPNGNGGYDAAIDFGLVIATGTPIPTATTTAIASVTPTLTQPPISTNTPALPTPTVTRTPVPTGTTTPMVTNTPGATATPCAITFVDVHPGDYFYEGVTYLSCNGIVSGYPDGTFRPWNNTTRAQLAKIVVLSQGWTLENPQAPTFSDVPYGSTFYRYIETAVAHGIITGYPGGTFLPNTSVTRSQVCKIVVLARGWTLLNPHAPTFSDVPYGSTFYQHIETAVAHGVVSGYPDTTFRPNRNAVRGQIAKIVYLALNS
jgi:protocatechuate 3,4-dioxygenase beta subunit